jgi:hypothetical protein
MNLYLRLTWTAFKTLFAPHLAVGESVELKLRVLPTDVDINGHMNNAHASPPLPEDLLAWIARDRLLGETAKTSFGLTQH